MSSLTIFSALGKIEIVDERNYRLGAEDNARHYQQEYKLQNLYMPTSIHGVLLDDAPLAVFGAAGGCSAVHANSALTLDAKLYLAVGDTVVCFALDERTLCWATVVDPATCFGLYHQRERDALSSHGELEIARLDKHGSVLWASAGADIFSEGICLRHKCVDVTDFNGRAYRFDYQDGRPL